MTSRLARSLAVLTRSVAALATLACAHQQSVPPAASADAYRAFVDDYLAAALADSPAYATGLGIHDRDAQLDDASRAHVEARIAELEALRERLSRIDRAALPPDDAVDAEALDLAMQSQLIDATQIRSWERNPMGYASLPGGAIDGLIKRAFAPAPERLRSVIGRLRAVPRVYAAARENLAHPPRVFTELAIRMSKGSESFFTGTLTAFAREAARDDAALFASFEAANAAALQSLRDFTRWLESDLLARSDGDFVLGEKLFLEKLRVDELVEIPLPALLARGEAQLEKDRAAFLAIGATLAPGATPAELVKKLSDDHPSADELLPQIAASVERARQFAVDKDLITFPSEERVRVAETPPFARDGSFASMDSPGPFETRATEAFYYVTPVEKEWDEAHKESHLRAFNRPVQAMVNVHEAYPGHYTQFLYSRRWPTKARRLIGTGTNIEGWAHYTEQMMLEQGFGGGDPLIKLGQLSEALLRDCRYVVGIKLHTQGMTIAEGAQMFEERCFQQKSAALEESQRGAYNPTYLYYTLGKLLIQDLARDYMSDKHATLKQFHDAFVAQGGLALPLVRRLLLGQK